jgi:hypothetical protein
MKIVFALENCIAIVVELCSSAHLNHISELLTDFSGIPPNDYALFYNGKALPLNWSFSDLQITSNSIILIVRKSSLRQNRPNYVVENKVRNVNASNDSRLDGKCSSCTVENRTFRVLSQRFILPREERWLLLQPFSPPSAVLFGLIFNDSFLPFIFLLNINIFLYFILQSNVDKSIY